MSEKLKIRIAYITTAIFLVISAVLIVKEQYWLSAAFPAAVAIMWLYIFRMDWVMLLIVFATPLAIPLSNLDMGVSLSLPTEPLLIGVFLMAILKTLFSGEYDVRIIRHPITLSIFFSLIWMFFTSITSELPVVSLKYFLSRLWFVIPLYFVGIILFRKLKNIKRFNWFYIVPLMMVIAYTTKIHASYGFDEDVSHWAMTPFYNDHTAYGAILAMMLPFAIGSTFLKKYSFNYRVAAGVVSFILLVALFLSSSRAAWISFIAAFGVMTVIFLKIKFRYIFFSLVVLVGLFFSFQHQILDVLEDNDQDSSGNFTEHIQSMYNISTDASNLERINRWSSAIRLFKDRPVVGYGPGTYQFVYAPFQRSKEKTIISTNFGDMGNAHSEFLGPMAESGVLGLVYVVLLAMVGLNRGYRLYQKSVDPEVKMLALVSMLGLTTYWIHGFLNVFLDTDKLSVPVWGYLAIIVALDLYHNQKKDKTIPETTT